MYFSILFIHAIYVYIHQRASFLSVLSGLDYSTSIGSCKVLLNSDYLLISVLVPSHTVCFQSCQSVKRINFFKSSVFIIVFFFLKLTMHLILLNLSTRHSWVKEVAFILVHPLIACLVLTCMSFLESIL